MPNLEVLVLVADEQYAAHHFFHLGRYFARSLRRLCMIGLRMGDPNGFLILISLRRTLRHLNVTDTNITPDVAEALRMAMPDCEILPVVI